MGIGYAAFSGLLDLSTRFTPAGRSLMLGRQKLRVGRPLNKRSPARDIARYERLLKNRGLDPDTSRFVQKDGYSEQFFTEIGFGKIEALDFAAYEDAALVWDMNQPIPENLHSAFGFIFDGGTLEHIFDVRQSFENVHDMLAPGGRFVAVTPFNGYPGHGFYQFSPELIWTYWKRGKGCTVLACRAIEPDGGFERDMPDPDEDKRRHNVTLGPRWRGRMPTGQILLWYEIEKNDGSQAGSTVLQSDYETTWNRRSA